MLQTTSPDTLHCPSISPKATEPALWRFSATEAIAAVRSGRIRVLDWAQALIRRIEQIEPRLHAWTFFDADRFCEHARRIDERIGRGQTPAPLWGTPVGIKDIIDTVDMPTQMGSPIWQGFTPGHNARIVDRLLWKGALIAGKTVTAEFAVHHPGPTVNPHDTGHTPGTSSSGSAVAVASGMVPIAIGTQTLGSLIRPASYNGVYAFKPTFGLIPRVGILKTTDTLDQVGYYCRCVDDLHLVFDAVAHIGPNYPLTKPLAPAGGALTQNLKIGWVHTAADAVTEPYVLEALRGFAAALDDHADLQVEELWLPAPFDEIWDVHQTIWEKCLSYYFKEEFETHPDLVSPVMREMILRGRQVPLDVYVAGLARQTQYMRQVDALFDRYDALITPAAASEAPKGLTSPDRRDNILIWTMCGVPVVHAPLFKGPQGLPFGVQLVARRFADRRLLAFVHRLAERGMMPQAPQPPLAY